MKVSDAALVADLPARFRSAPEAGLITGAGISLSA